MITVVPYDPIWPARFRAVAESLRALLGATALRIDHIGSTSIPGLAAKDVIDVQISVLDLDPLPSIERLGYRFRKDNPDLTKRYFREAEGTPEVHIHVRRAGSFSEQIALVFRDFLRAHAEHAARYESVKRELAATHDDRTAYTDAKGPIVWTILEAASAWSQRIGWAPGRSDA